MKSLTAEEEEMSNAEVVWVVGEVQRVRVSRRPGELISVSASVAPSFESAYG